MKRLFLLVATGAAIISLLAGNIATAHVVVKPSEAPAASFQTFTVSVPNEKSSDTTAIKLIIPSGLQNVMPTQKAGWDITTEKSHGTVTSITWTGTLVPERRDDFTFSAKLPATNSELHWKAYQTYDDGSTVAWDKAVTSNTKDSSDAGPFSVTKVTARPAVQTPLQTTQQTADDARNAADRAYYVAITATVIGLAGVFFATKRK